MSEERKKRPFGSGSKKESTIKSENKREVLSFTIDENITKKQHPDPASGYCYIF